MDKTIGKVAILGVSAVGLLGTTTPAWAYLDPGTGSMIISAIVGLFATVGLAVKTYWYKIKAFFRRDAQPESARGNPAGESPVESGANAPQSPEH